MPLSKAKMRERKRLDRVKPKSNLNDTENVKPKLAHFGLKIEGNKIVGLTNTNIKPKLPPVFNPRTSKQGDLVRVRGSNIEVVVPDLDAEGNPVPEY